MPASNVPLNYLSAFLGGVVVSFTPCAYPLIPVCMAYIGVKAAQSHLTGFLLSLTYVTGMAVTYAALGLIASMTGTLFGAISTHPVTTIITGGIMIVFGISMFEVLSFSFSLPLRLPLSKQRNYLSVLLLGISSGMVVGPCLTPVLGSILLYLAKRHNLVYGATLLFTFAYGMGLVLIVVSTFTSVLTSLPRAGSWLTVIQRIAGLILVGVGLFYIITGIRRML